MWPLPVKERKAEWLSDWLRESVRRVLDGKAFWPLVLVGGVRSGKTCAALLIADAAGAACYTDFATLCDWNRMAQQGALAYSSGHPKSSIELWREWTNANVGILDELGLREKCSDFQYETLKRAIDTREGKPCVFVSNLTIDELAKVYDDRIAARLAEGTVLTMRES